MRMYMTVKQAAEKWGISDRRVRTLCTEGKIPGAFQEGRGWKIPIDAVKPTDGRYKSSESLLEMIDRKKSEVHIPLIWLRHFCILRVFRFVAAEIFQLN